LRLDRALIVAKKDFAEFKKNRYIMATLLFMPLVVAVILPMIYVIPINELGRQRGNPIGLELNITYELSDAYLSNESIFDARLSNVTIKNCIIQGSTIGNSTIVNSRVNGSEMSNSTIRGCYITGSNIFYPKVNEENSITGSQIIGSDTELRKLQDIMFNVLLILLVMIPVTIPTVTASYSFVGEKMNRSLEPLLATPISDLELLVGKSSSIFAMSMGATWSAFVVSILMVDFLTEPVLGYNPLPTLYWIIGIVVLAPGMCMLSILANVIISSKVNDVRVSQQIGGVVILPVLIFFFISIGGLISSGITPLLLFCAVIFAVDLGVLWLSTRTFQREEILVSWK